jgi:hypothetical protein
MEGAETTFDTIASLWEWALFKDIDFLVEACEKYFVDSNKDINPLSRIGIRRSLYQFYQNLKSPLNFEGLRRFDEIASELLIYIRFNLIFFFKWIENNLIDWKE